MSERLHSDAVRVLSGWSAPDRRAATSREQTLELLHAGPVAMTREHRPGHVTASAMVVNADATRVLLCLHGVFHRWVQLGGHCEPSDRSLSAAALREASEESGIDGLLLDPTPIDVDIHPVTCDGHRSRHCDVRYAVLAPPGAVEQVSDESRALGWFPPDALPEPLADATAVLVAPALAAARRLRDQPASAIAPSALEP